MPRALKSHSEAFITAGKADGQLYGNDSGQCLVNFHLPP